MCEFANVSVESKLIVDGLLCRKTGFHSARVISTGETLTVYLWTMVRVIRG
jgi:hypothetical protein